MLPRWLVFCTIPLLPLASSSAQTLTPHQQNAFDIYKELVEINTVTATGDTERPVEAMAAHLRAAGFTDSDVQVFSPVPRNAWKDATVVRSETYRPWAEQVAKASGAAFVDLNGLVAAKYDALGRAAVAPFFPSDDTHTSRAGAELTAAIVTAAVAVPPQKR